VPSGGAYKITETASENGRKSLAISGRIEINNMRAVLAAALTQLGNASEGLDLDLSGVDYFDSGGGAFLIELRRDLNARGVALRVTRSTPAIDGFLDLVDQDALAQPLAKAIVVDKPFATQIGGATLEILNDARELVVFTGELMLGLLAAVRHPRRMRWRETWLYMERSGIDAVPIVALISFLMGLITAFQASVQLSQFGADIYVANLVGLSIVRELGPLMTAIIAAGRSGAAFAAEIGTMKVSEEVDALTTMGFDRTRFLVTPKVIALILMLPCLTLIADVVGILGGLFVSVVGLDMPPQVFLRQTRIALDVWDVASGLVKSFAFAVLIAGVGCLRGFQARSGAESVGRVTTSAIVAGIFLIIVADAVFTMVFHFW